MVTSLEGCITPPISNYFKLPGAPCGPKCACQTTLAWPRRCTPTRANSVQSSPKAAPRRVLQTLHCAGGGALLLLALLILCRPAQVAEFASRPRPATAAVDKVAGLAQSK